MLFQNVGIKLNLWDTLRPKSLTTPKSGTESRFTLKITSDVVDMKALSLSLSLLFEMTSRTD